MADVRRVTNGTPRLLPDLGIDGSPELVFQPAVDLATGRILGFEALLRWNVPGRGVVSPADLIPWAERHGYMTALSTWVLVEACSQAARWQSDLQVAVNCSIFQLRRQEVAVAAAAALEQTGLNPDRLTVEVTSNAVADTGAAADLDALVRQGVQLSVDDIGSDGAILRDPGQLAVNTMKIDQALIEGLDSGATRAMVETVIKLSHALGMCAVAECVETAAQLAILRELRADVAQGWFFSPPVSAEEAFALSTLDPPPAYSLTVPRQLVATAHAKESPPVSSPRDEVGSPSPTETPGAPVPAGTETLQQALTEMNQSLRRFVAAVERLNQLLQARQPEPPALWISETAPIQEGAAQIDCAPPEPTSGGGLVMTR
jgi:EAL domain-containing protein (putative c-di-GMP-specific phosphodiesterase class I)